MRSGPGVPPDLFQSVYPPNSEESHDVSNGRAADTTTAQDTTAHSTVAHGHSHSPGHGPMPSASRHTRRIVTAILVPAAVATVIALFVLWPARLHAPQDNGLGVQALGTVHTITAQQCPAIPDHPAAPGRQLCGTATIQLTDGPGKGRQVTVALPNGPGAPQVRPGDKVVLLYQPAAGQAPETYAIQDEQRGAP